MSNEQEKFLLKLSTNLYIITDAAGIINYASPKAVLLFGFPANKDIDLSRFLNNENWVSLKQHITSALESKIPEYFSLRHQNRVFNVYIHSHEGLAYQCWEDITERRQLSQALHRTSERIEFAERATNVGYWEFDIQARRLYWSTEMYRLLGIDDGYMPEQNMTRNYILPEDYPAYKNQLHEMIRTGEPAEGILRLRRADDKIIHCSYRSAFFRDGERKKIAGIVFKFHPTPTIVKAKQAMKKNLFCAFAVCALFCACTPQITEPIKSGGKSTEIDLLHSENANINKKFAKFNAAASDDLFAWSIFDLGG